MSDPVKKEVARSDEESDEEGSVGEALVTSTTPEYMCSDPRQTLVPGHDRAFPDLPSLEHLLMDGHNSAQHSTGPPNTNLEQNSDDTVSETNYTYQEVDSMRQPCGTNPCQEVDSARQICGTKPCQKVDGTKQASGTKPCQKVDGTKQASGTKPCLDVDGVKQDCGTKPCRRMDGDKQQAGPHNPIGKLDSTSRTCPGAIPKRSTADSQSQPRSTTDSQPRSATDPQPLREDLSFENCRGPPTTDWSPPPIQERWPCCKRCGLRIDSVNQVLCVKCLEDQTRRWTLREDNMATDLARHLATPSQPQLDTSNQAKPLIQQKREEMTNLSTKRNQASVQKKANVSISSKLKNSAPVLKKAGIPLESSKQQRSTPAGVSNNHLAAFCTDRLSPCIAETPNKPAKTQHKKERYRCAFCNKKVAKIQEKWWVCRCKKSFCRDHRLSEEHQCTYDFKTAGRAQMKKQYPKIVAQKILKID